MADKLICFDMDGTLIRNTNSVEYLCKLSGKEKEVAEIEAKERWGEINWIDADFIKATFIRGLKVKDVEKFFDEYVTLISNIPVVIEILKALNYDVILVTAGPIQVARTLEKRFGFDAVFGSIYEELDGAFTGRIIKHLGDHGKYELVKKYCEKNEICPDQVVAIGDSDSDVEVFRFSGRSIAINYTNTLKGKATDYITTNDLAEILQFIK